MIDLTLTQSCKALEAFLASVLQREVHLSTPVLLTGGASRASWRLTVRNGQEQHFVLRQDMGGTIHDEALSREQEYRLIEIARQQGVAVPEPRALCTDEKVLGAPFFLMDFVPGESVGRKIVREPSLEMARQKLPEQMAQQLARIHAMPWEPVPDLPHPGDISPAQSAVQSSLRLLDRIGEPHPALEMACRWLTLHAPPCPELVLCHGDFRLGNLMIDANGLQSVLDWEFAHVGDPVEDLAWPCTKSWRFGNDDLRLGGIGPFEPFLEAYATASGRDAEELQSRMQWWEIMSNFRWAIGCMQQAHRHLSGQAPSIELMSLGRRTAEVEQELLSLIDQATT